MLTSSQEFLIELVLARQPVNALGVFTHGGCCPQGDANRASKVLPNSIFKAETAPAHCR